MHGFLGHRFRLTTLWLVFFVGILGGLGLAHEQPFTQPVLIGLLIPFVMFSLRRRRLISLGLILLFGLSLGWFRGSVHMSRLGEYQPVYGQKVTIYVKAMGDGVYNQTKQLAFDANDIRLEGGMRLTGKISVSGYGANAVFQGDELVLTGKLRPSSYEVYQGRMSYATIQVIKHHPTLISEVRRKFMAGTQTALPEPLAPFVMGILVGQRINLPEQTKEDMQKVGLTHIVAVSGANLTIILQATRRLVGKRSKRLSTFITLALMGIFLLIAGACASLVRAAMVSVLSIMASYYGRSFKPLNLILLAAVITAMVNPVYLWSDLSWYLSFLAFFGVMVLSPLIQARWSGKWQDSVILGVALESLCAELLTLPFVLHIFGQMSRVGLLANVLVVALIPLAMLLGAIAGLAGMLASSISGWFAWPAVILLNYMLDVAHILAGWRNVFVEGISLSLSQMLMLYTCLAFIVTVLWYKNSKKNAIITDMTELKTKGLIA